MEEIRYALITGASRGIGKAIAVRLAKDGYRIILNYVSNDLAAQETLEEVRKAGSEAELLKFDVSDTVATAQALSEWENTHPGEYISVLVNNAGITRDGLMMRMPEDDWHKVLGIVLDGFYNTTKPLLKNMLSNRWGRIINISSLSGIRGQAGQTNYSAAKGGLIASTKALALEVAKRGVTVNAVAPGFIRTDMTSTLPEEELKKMIPAGRFGEAEEVADLVAFLASANASYITGEVISINGGLYT
jgi:3-oxoacyl-[acyl-carrier protein] reductase